MTAAAVRAVIRELYRQVEAPEWAATNLDGLADVLRDLSWLPPGLVRLHLPDLAALSDGDRIALERVVHRAVAQTSTSPRPVRAETPPPVR